MARKKKSDIIKVRVTAHTNKVGSDCLDELEFERKEWNAMSDEQKEEACRDAAFQMMEWYWEEIE